MSDLKQRFRKAWTALSRIGLRDGESVVDFREVILLNRLIGLMMILMLFYIPAEIIVNGWDMIPAVIIMGLCELVTLLFHRIRWFRAAKYYLYFFTTGFVMIMGLTVGREIQNYVIFIPIVIVATILFKTNTERIVIFLITVGAFLLQRHLFGIISPPVQLSPGVAPVLSTVFFILGMTVTFLSGYYFVGINKEYEAIIVQQNARLETRNREVTDSINYARRIQTAILPAEELISEHLPESFILYKPKDIVAGDFYWVEHINDHVLIAAADCTGHGVPGAMVSVICYNALNRCVRENNLTDPGKILDNATAIVISEFGKSNEEVKDGMDISLCALAKKSNQLLWSGANNPLWIVRNGKLLEWKADKQPVGKHSITKPFTTHVIQLQANDMAYIFTDGYYDQFGGGKGKKFKTARLKELLLTIHALPLQEQHTVLDTSFTEWKGVLDQVDDVCLIGFRV